MDTSINFLSVQIFQILEIILCMVLLLSFFEVRYFSKIKARWLFFFGLDFIVLQALLFTFWQYNVWQGNEFGRLLLPPNQSWLYFFRYSSFHFWLNPFISLVIASFFASVLHLFRQRRVEVMDKKEWWLIFSASLYVGWPGQILLLPLALVFFLVGNLINTTIFKNERTRMAPYFIITGILLLIFGNYLASFFDLSVFGV